MGNNMTDFAPIYLTVPGLNGSGREHWQTIWEGNRDDFRRVEQASWDDPQRDQWVDALHRAIVEPGAPIILIAHSLGCITAAWWAAAIAQGYGRPVAGALLVAPPEVERPDAHPILRRFAPLPVQPLPFPSIVVASANDPYASLEQSRRMARIWQAHFVDIGAYGHINAASGLGQWEAGKHLLERLVSAAVRRSDASPSALVSLTAPPAIEISSVKEAWG